MLNADASRVFCRRSISTSSRTLNVVVGGYFSGYFYDQIFVGASLETLNTVASVDSYVRSSIGTIRLGAFTLILGRPWLRDVGAIQDWGKGTICVYGKKGEKMVFDMTTKQPLELEDMSENDKSEVTSEDSFEDSESSITSSSSDEGEVSFLLLDEEKKEVGEVLQVSKNVHASSCLEQLEELMQPKQEFLLSCNTRFLSLPLRLSSAQLDEDDKEEEERRKTQSYLKFYERLSLNCSRICTLRLLRSLWSPKFAAFGRMRSISNFFSSSSCKKTENFAICE
ncbi:hypothetical protein L7F22_059825 [Adiantum nelumboides]|nr:hypothetical protein [Adiantum nelumboides]